METRLSLRGVTGGRSGEVVGVYLTEAVPACRG